MFAADMRDQMLRIAAAGIGWVGADCAEFAEAGELDAFACHGYELFLMADAVVIAELPGVDVVVAGLDAVDQVEHFGCVGWTEGFDGWGRRCGGDGLSGGFCFSVCRQDHLGAGEFEFRGPVFWEYGQAADDIKYLSGFYPGVEVVEGIGAGYKGEKTFAVAFGMVGSQSKIFMQSIQCPPGGVV